MSKRGCYIKSTAGGLEFCRASADLHKFDYKTAKARFETHQSYFEHIRSTTVVQGKRAILLFGKIMFLGSNPWTNLFEQNKYSMQV